MNKNNVSLNKSQTPIIKNENLSALTIFRRKKSSKSNQNRLSASSSSSLSTQTTPERLHLIRNLRKWPIASRTTLSTISVNDKNRHKSLDQRMNRLRNRSMIKAIDYRPYQSSSEAFFSSINLEQFDTDHPISNEEILNELSKSNIEGLSNTVHDPERFLYPASGKETPLLERLVNPIKIFDYLVDFMDQYYNLEEDRDPCARWRETMDEKLWDNFAYIIPVVCRQMIEILQNENTIITTGPDVIVFGDLHGNLNDVHYIYRNFLNEKKYLNFKFIFLGDYIDRGPKSIEVLLFLFSIKMISPKRYILLRGNHEVSKVNKKYGFKCLVEHIYKNTYIKNPKILYNLIYRSFNQAFNHLPVGVVIRFKNQKGIFCCHGGVPNEMYNHDQPWTINELNKLGGQFKPHDLIPRKNCRPEQSALNEILWNDPVSQTFARNHSNNLKMFYQNKKRGGHCSKFSEEAVNRFLRVNNLRLLIRGHQFKCCKEKGYRFHFSDQTLTVFSSSNYCGIQENTTGYVLVTENNFQPMILRSAEESRPFRQFNRFELILDELSKEVVKVIF